MTSAIRVQSLFSNTDSALLFMAKRQPLPFVSNRSSAAYHAHHRPRIVIRASQHEDVPFKYNMPSSLGDFSSDKIQGASLPDTFPKSTQALEARIERAIYNCRFLTLFAVTGSLAGSVLCFLKGSGIVIESFKDYFLYSWRSLGSGRLTLLLVEAVDMYLMGTVMLILGTGLYQLFVSRIHVPAESGGEHLSRKTRPSNFFGLFLLLERPRWLKVESLDELKTTLGHTIVMILLVGLFEKSKKVPITNSVDFLCFSTSILLTSGCIFLLSKLHAHETAHPTA